MADNVARIRFGVEGGASISEGSGEQIYRELLGIASNINKDGKLKLKFNIDDKSLQKSQVFSGLVDQLKSLEQLVDTISKKKFSVNNFIKQGAQQFDLGNQRKQVEAYGQAIANAIKQINRLRVGSPALQGKIAGFGELFNAFTNAIPDIDKRLESRSSKGLNSLLADLDKYAEAVRKMQQEVNNLLPESIQFDQIVRPDIFKQETQAIQQEQQALRLHVEDVQVAANAEALKAQQSSNVANALGKETRAFNDSSSAATNHAQQTIFTLEELRTLLTNLGASESAVNNTIDSLEKSGMAVAKVDQYYDDLDGRLSAIKITASDAAGAIKEVISASLQPETEDHGEYWAFSQGDSVNYFKQIAQAKKEAAQAAKDAFASDKAWSNAETAAYDNLIQKTQAYYDIKNKIARDPKSSNRAQWDDALYRAEAQLRTAKETAEYYVKLTSNQLKYDQALEECNQIALRHEEILGYIADKDTTSKRKADARAMKEAFANEAKIQYELDDAEDQALRASEQEKTAINEQIELLKVKLEAARSVREEYAKLPGYAKLIADNEQKSLEHLAELNIAAGRRADQNADKNANADSKEMNRLFSEREAAWRRLLQAQKELLTAEGVYRDQVRETVSVEEQTIESLDRQLEQYRELDGFAERQAQSNRDAAQANRDFAESAAQITSKQNDGWNDLAQKMSKLGPVSERFKNQYKELQDLIAARGPHLKEATQKYHLLADAIKEANKQTDVNTKAQKDQEKAALTYQKLTNKVTTYFHKFEDEIKKNPQLLAQYNQLLENLATQGFGEASGASTKAAAAVQAFQIACERAGVGTNSFIKKIVSGFGNKLLYGGLAKAAAEIRRLARQIYTNVTEIDAAATQLRIVTNGSASDMKQYYDDAAESAKRLAVSIKDVINATTVYARLGYSASESNVLAEYTSMLTKVGDIDTSAATDAVTALVKAFDLDLSDVQLVMDQMVEVGKQNCPTAWRHAA